MNETPVTTVSVFEDSNVYTSDKYIIQLVDTEWHEQYWMCNDDPTFATGICYRATDMIKDLIQDWDLILWNNECPKVEPTEWQKDFIHSLLQWIQ